jgi:hypothetical protein
MVAVVSEIVSTISAAENASSIFGTIPNLNFFIPLALSSVVGPPADTHRDVYVRRRQRLITGYAVRSELHTLLVLDREFPAAVCADGREGEELTIAFWCIQLHFSFKWLDLSAPDSFTYWYRRAATPQPALARNQAKSRIRDGHSDCEH